MSDPYAAERAKNAFLDTLMRGHSDGSWAILELKMLLLAKKTGGQTKHEVGERLQRASRLLRSAANHIDAARSRAP